MNGVVPPPPDPSALARAATIAAVGEPAVVNDESICAPGKPQPCWYMKSVCCWLRKKLRKAAATSRCLALAGITSGVVGPPPTGEFGEADGNGNQPALAFNDPSTPPLIQEPST